MGLNNPKRSEEFGDVEKRVRSLLYCAKASDVQPPAHLTAKVLSRVRQKEDKSAIRFWKIFSAFGTLTCAILVGLLFVPERTVLHHAVINRAMSVKVQLNDGEMDRGVAYAEMILPTSVSFVSNRFPAIRDERSLLVPWKSGSELPFVVRSAEVGQKSLQVRFFNSKGTMLFEREINIVFERKAKRPT